MNLDKELSSQVPDLDDDDLLQDDPVLQAWLLRGRLQADATGLGRYGRELGTAARRRQGAQANQEPPQWQAWSPQGRRIDHIEFHPAWHALMSLGMEQGLHIWPHTREPGAHLARAMAFYMHGQIEAGTLCPMTMTRAAAPLLQADGFEDWRRRLDVHQYDPAARPVVSKYSVLLGMGMTEMQGGSDLRGCSTQALPDGAGFRLHGHKWFFSVPQADAHLVLAREQDALSCFLVPRHLPDGLNNLRIRRLKDKLGNRSNASAEIEFDGAWGRRVGEPGRGIALLAAMAGRTRIDCVLGSAALMRQALVQSLHYCRHRRAFGKVLLEQPLMQAVLLDMALESEAAAHLAFFLAELQQQVDHEQAQGVLRVLAPAAKFWVCRRAVALCAEAMETWGGNGYVEDGPMPRLLREAPVNSIWEGSGNVMCLDVQRALAQSGVQAALQADLLDRCAGDARLRRVAQELWAQSAQAGERAWPQALILLYQACLMRELAPAPLADLFIAQRLERGPTAVFGIEGAAQPVSWLERSWRRLQA